MAENDIVLQVEGLRVELDPSGADIDDEVTLWVRKGEVLGLVGESASGKTTAATALLAHERRGAKVTGGSVSINGRSVLTMKPSELRSIRGGLISYVPQDPSMSLNPALRINTQLTEILEWHSYGASKEERGQRVAEMMAEVLLPSDKAFLRRYPHQLSGGQQQRVAVAMAFACRPAMIVLDEPTTGLDVTTQAHVLETVKALTRTYGVAALYVTHDLAVVANLADRIAVMYAGRLVEFGRKDQLFRRASHPYTRKLLAAVPDLSGKHELRGIPGRAPVPGHRPEGCFFAPRCESAIEKCLEAFPPYDGPSDEHRVRCWRWREVGDKPVLADLVLRDLSRRTALPHEDPVVSVRGLKAWYESHEILHGIDAVVHARRCLALVGESGSGKTTMARCIAGIHPGKISGAISLNGSDLGRESRGRSKQDRRAIQYIFQSPYGSLNPRKSIAQILAAPLKTFFRLNRIEMEERMVAALETVSLDAALLSRYPDQLSGGERQRVAIARALAAEPSVLICDEVTSSLDVSVQASIVELLTRLLEETGVAMIFVTHHLPLVRSLAQEVAVMHQGQIVESGAVDEVLSAPQADYTRRLLSDTPDVELVDM
jgi:peptide/nickel transport system ATP-binding protein